eukprot:g26252.t1
MTSSGSKEVWGEHGPGEGTEPRAEKFRGQESGACESLRFYNTELYEPVELFQAEPSGGRSELAAQEQPGPGYSSGLVREAAADASSVQFPTIFDPFRQVVDSESACSPCSNSALSPSSDRGLDPAYRIPLDHSDPGPLARDISWKWEEDPCLDRTDTTEWLLSHWLLKLRRYVPRNQTHISAADDETETEPGSRGASNTLEAVN